MAVAIHQRLLQLRLRYCVTLPGSIRELAWFPRNSQSIGIESRSFDQWW